MGLATQKMAGGRVIGWSCEHGHTHTTAADAQGCDPKKFAAAEAEKKAQALQTQRELVLADKRYPEALRFIQDQFEVEDEGDAEGIVVLTGFDKIFQLKADLATIKALKPAKPPKPPAKPAAA